MARTSRNPKFTKKGKAAKALNLARKNAKVIKERREIKSIAVGIDTTPDSTAQVAHLSAIAQGLDDDDRIGNKITAFSVLLEGNAVMHETATTTLMRILIVRDRFGTTAQPAILDMFASVATFVNGHPPLGDTQVASRFQVLVDKIIVFSDVGTKIVHFKKYKKLSFPIYYENTAAADEGKNNIYLFTGSTEATNVPAVSAVAKFKWIG